MASLSQQLAVSDVVNVTVNLASQPVADRNFGALMIVGSSPVIDTSERFRVYTQLGGVATDFGTTAPEYLAAVDFFAQPLAPALLYIGRWAEVATSGVLHGARLTAAQQAISTFNAVTAGSLKIALNGAAATQVTGINLSAAQNLNAVASAIQTALAGAATVVWNANYSRFDVTSAQTGATSSISYATTPSTGTDLGPLLGLTQAAGAGAPVQGIAAESPVQAVQALANASGAWYGIMIADTSVTDSQHLAVSAFIEAAVPSRVYGITTQESGAVDPTSTTDMAALLSALKYQRTITLYCSTDPFAIASVFGIAFSVDFTGSDTVLTLKFQQLPGILAEALNETQAAALDAKHCNVLVQYQNGASILQQGWMASGRFFDSVQGFDWLQNHVQTAIFNLLLSVGTKIKQTDSGMELMQGVVENALAQGVVNGLLAPGEWTSGLTFGPLVTGQILAKAFLVYTPPVRTQSAADRAARKGVLMQIAVTGAGAVHFASAIINVVQ